jgi:hypothetical protein
VTRLTGWDFFAWMGLRRVNRGGLAKLGERYLDGGRPVPGFLVPHVVEALIEDGMIELGPPDLDSGGMRRAGLTEAGRARYGELCRQQRRRPDPPVPPPQLATTTTTKTPAGRRSSAPVPGGQPDPALPVVPPMRWAWRAADVRMHALDPVGVQRAPARGYARTLCGDALPPDVATAEHPAGELCLPCVIRFAALLPPELRQCAQPGEEDRRGG